MKECKCFRIKLYVFVFSIVIASFIKEFKKIKINYLWFEYKQNKYSAVNVNVSTILTLIKLSETM